MSDAVLAALRGSCSHVCSYATPHAPGSGCGGVCKRSLNDFDNEEIQNMTIALRAALAVMPDQYRLGWIAGRAAAAEVCRREAKSVKAEDYDDYAIGREVGCHACMTTIKAMEPPA